MKLKLHKLSMIINESFSDMQIDQSINDLRLKTKEERKELFNCQEEVLNAKYSIETQNFQSDSLVQFFKYYLKLG